MKEGFFEVCLRNISLPLITQSYKLVHASPTEGRLIKTTCERREERMHLHRRTLRLSLHADPVDLWLAQPRETFWYKMLLKEFESVDSLERMDKSDEAMCSRNMED